jgi:hypothetical protein
MTSHSFEQAKSRIKGLQNKREPSEDCLRELSTFTFDFEKVQKELHDLRPKTFFDLSEQMESLIDGK